MLRSVLSNWMTMVILGVISFLLTPLLIHSLGMIHYGMWILVASVLDHYVLLDMGLHTTLQRFVARMKGRNEREALTQIFSTAYGLGVIAAILTSGLTVVLALFLPRFFALGGESPELLSWVVLSLGLSVAVTFPARVPGAYLCGLQRFDLYNLASISLGVLRALLFVAALQLGYGILVLANLTLTVSILSMYVNYRVVRWLDPELSLDVQRFRWHHAKELARFGFYVFVNRVGDRLRFNIDSLVIGRLLGIALVTPFSVAAKLVEYFKNIILGFLGPTITEMSLLDGESRIADLQKLFIRSTKASAVLSLLIGSLFYLDGRPLLRLWLGEDFVSVYPLLLTLTIGYVVGLAQSPSNGAIYARGRHRPLAWWALAEGMANLLLSVYWAKRYGLMGVAFGTIVPMLVVKIFLLPYYTLRVLELTLREYLTGALLRPLAAAALFLFCAITWGAPAPPADFLHLLQTVAWQVLLYGFLAYFIGLDRQERRYVRERGRRLAVDLRFASAS